jgi:hypothetical protein
MQQDRLAGLDAIGLADQVLRREAFEHHGRGGLVIEAVGQLDQAIGRDQPRFGISSQRRAAIGDAVARLQVSDARADFLDHAGALAAQTAWERNRIDSGTIVDVDKIQAHGGMADACLAGAGLAELDFFPDQNFRTTGLMKADRMRHGVIPHL